jgi:hypothetical protein
VKPLSLNSSFQPRFCFGPKFLERTSISVLAASCKFITTFKPDNFRTLNGISGSTINVPIRPNVERQFDLFIDIFEEPRNSPIAKSWNRGKA